MTEPTQEEFGAAEVFYYNEIDHPEGWMPHEVAAVYANHRTAELQAKIDRLETNFVSLKRVTADRIAALEAELAARDFVPITDEHRNGLFWDIGYWHEAGFFITQGWWPTYKTEYPKQWKDRFGNPIGNEFTHAAPLPKPPAKEGAL